MNMKNTIFVGCKIHHGTFIETCLTEADFSNTDLQGTRFHTCDLRKANFSHAKNYRIDLQVNKIKKAKFSFPECINLLSIFDLEILYH